MGKVKGPCLHTREAAERHVRSAAMKECEKRKTVRQAFTCRTAFLSGGYEI